VEPAARAWAAERICGGRVSNDMSTDDMSPYDRGMGPGDGSGTEGMALVRLLDATGQAVGRFHRRAVAEHGLTPTAIGALGVLARSGGLSHRELAARVGVTPATLTPVVDALVAAAAIVRTRDTADRRVVRLSITGAGRERLATASEAVAARLRAELPRPAPEHETIIRGYLAEVLAVIGDAEARRRWHAEEPP
jgi:MarR family transcriptional regulator, organic hydroperoxide resistance regulator